jgi:hypothetical protein
MGAVEVRSWVEAGYTLNLFGVLEELQALRLLISVEELQAINPLESVEEPKAPSLSPWLEEAEVKGRVGETVLNSLRESRC